MEPQALHAVGMIGKGKVRHTPLNSIDGCWTLCPKPWASRWRTTNVWCVASTFSATKHHCLLAGTNYTAWLVTEACVQTTGPG